ncbi:hypothetical protein [Nocardioides sp. URHA0032]|uniref:hypothetical protein n=1 Tax=Nocardioides sp. URHA0032 TaxID=1380388 RepID=UPI000A7D55D3|nr:hypothetical protein [Nocardioides sp. URHA0032]
MPGKGTKRHAIRIDDELWDAALHEAADRGEDLSTAIRRFLRDYINQLDKR